MRIKICFLISSLCEGPTNVLYNIVKHINYNLFKVSIVTMVPEKETSLIDDFKALPVEVIQISPEKFLNPLAMGLKMRDKIKKVNPDIVHVHCPRSRLLSPFIPSSCKTVETIHNYPDLPKVLYGKIKGTLVKHLSTFMTRRMDLIIPCSESIGKCYDEMGVKNVPIPNGCSMPIWRYDLKEKTELKKQLGLDENLKYFIYVGRFSEEKNPNVVVEGFEKISDLPVALIMLGDGRMMPEMKKHEGDKIQMLGFKRDVQRYLKAADYFISASDSEGMPNSVLECLATGIPLLLSDIPAHREIMKKAKGVIGFLYDQKDSNSLTKVISDVVNLDLLTVSNNLHSLYLSYYTAKMMSERYQQEYLKLVTGQCPH